MPKIHHAAVRLAQCFTLMTFIITVAPTTEAATNYVLLGWSESGMQFIDNDYSVFAIHPPGNTIRAQIVQLINDNQARLLTNAAAAGITVTYEAVGDRDGSTNSTSQGKSNFWEFDVPLFGTNLNVDAGLLGVSMPGPANTPQVMTFKTNYSSFIAEGIPLTPYDDRGKFNPYPLFRLVARVGGIPVTNIDISVGVTDEMDCRLCHASGSVVAAIPIAGWEYDPNPERDYRLNILRLHDERQSTNPAYSVALRAKGYNAAGLFAHVKTSNQPILCSKCHYSSVIPGSGFGSIKPLTRAIHVHHASVIDPRDGQVLDSETNRATCYTCHGGALTHFLRGAMGAADTTSGQLAIQCQSCHGSMVQVGATNRIGWLSQPNCQACHVGDALNTVNGQIRFTTALTNGSLRLPANDRFATDPNTPSNGLSLFHLSRGHGNLMCSACHGPPHAEFPSSVANDNVRNLQVQGHQGVMAECQVCHGTQSLTPGNGPHGMHSSDYDWADGASALHPDAENDAACGPCHGTQGGTGNRGTVLSQARGDREFPGLAFGTIRMWKGQTIGCTHCHNSTALPTVTNTSASTFAGVPISFTLGSSTNSVRVVTQPAHGLVGLSNKVATYRPDPDFIGTDTFYFASAKPQKESLLATGTVVVSELYSTADGIPDWWRKLNFGGTGTSTNSVSCATCDPDLDGLSNEQEFRANTDPNNPRSQLNIFCELLGGNDVRIGFQSVVTRRYAVDVSTNMAAEIWSPVASNIWGRNTTVVLTATNSVAPSHGIFRVRTYK
jgi:hypothetical protein